MLDSKVRKGILSSFAGFLLFSVQDALIKTLSAFSVFEILFFAILFSYVPFSLALSMSGRPVQLRPKYPKLVLARSLLMSLTGILAFTAFSLLSMTEVYAMIFMSPVLISIMATLFLGERIALYRWLAIALGLVGVLIVLRPGGTTLGWGHVCGILAAFAIAISSVLSRKLGGKEHMAAATLWPMLCGLVVNGVLMLKGFQALEIGDLALMAAIGALGLGGQTLVLYGFRNAPAQFIAPVQYSQMLWAIALGMLFFADTPDRWVLIGGALIMLSGFLILWRESKISVNKPTLNSRNLRGNAGPAMLSKEYDEG